MGLGEYNLNRNLTNNDDDKNINNINNKNSYKNNENNYKSDNENTNINGKLLRKPSYYYF